jgi:hypothetical protein
LDNVGDDSGRARRRVAIPVALAAALALAVTAGVTAWAQTGDEPTGSNLSEEQRHEFYATASAMTATNQAAATEYFNASGQRIADLVRTEILISVDGPEPGFAELIPDALGVIRGTVIEQRFVSLPNNPGATRLVSTVEVTDPVHWSGSNRIELQQLAFPAAEAGGSFVLAETRHDPAVVTGDDIVALIARPESATASSRLPDGRYRAVPFKVLHVQNGRIVPHRDDESLAELEGGNVDDFIEVVRNASSALSSGVDD